MEYLQTLGYGPSLTILISAETEGDYTCQAATQGFPLVSATTSVRMKAPPLILTEPETLVTLGESAMVWCQSSSGEPSLGVDWSHNGVIITPDSQQFSVLDTRWVVVMVMMMILMMILMMIPGTETR